MSVKQNSMDSRQQYQDNELHIGNLIKSELAKQGRSITWLSSQVNCTRENLYKVFRRSWIYTDLLFEISEALNHDFFKDCSDYHKSRKDTKTQWHKVTVSFFVILTFFVIILPRIKFNLLSIYHISNKIKYFFKTMQTIFVWKVKNSI